jgi:flagellar FliL protein
MRKVLIIALLLLPVTFCMNSVSRGEEHEKKGEGASPQLIEEFILNIGGGTGNKFLKCSICFDFSKPTIAARVKARLAVLRDAVIMLVSAKALDSIISAEGKMQIKEELIMRINQLFGDNALSNVYFTDFIMQ